MFRDKKEELARLEAALWEEDSQEQEEEEWAFDDLDEEMQDFDDLPDFSVYNADPTDYDLDAYSEEVYHAPPRRPGGRWVWVLIFLTGILCLLGWWLLRQGGFL